MSFDVIRCNYYNRLEGPLPTGQFLCYMAMLKRSFESIPERKGDLSKVCIVILYHISLLL